MSTGPRIDRPALATDHRNWPHPPRLHQSQIQELKAAIKEADAGDFASDQETQAIFSKWDSNS